MTFQNSKDASIVRASIFALLVAFVCISLAPTHLSGSQTTPPFNKSINTTYNITSYNATTDLQLSPSPWVRVNLPKLNITLYMVATQFSDVRLITRNLTSLTYLAPLLPKNYTYLRLFNITTYSTDKINPGSPVTTTINVTSHYSCLAQPNKVVPLELYNGSWYNIVPFYINASDCTVHFKIYSDPIIAITQYNGSGNPKQITSIPTTAVSTISVASTSTITGGTTLVSTSTIFQLPSMPSGLFSYTSLLVVALAVILILFIIMVQLRYVRSRQKFSRETAAKLMEMKNRMKNDQNFGKGIKGKLDSLRNQGEEKRR